MSAKDKHNGEERDDDLVAAEYVLGVLPAAQRADAARRIDEDHAFAMKIAGWERRFADFNGEFGEISPPAGTWRKIEARLFPDAIGQANRKAGLWSSVAFWRVVSFASLAAASAFAVFVLATTPDVAPSPQYVASLISSESDAVFVAMSDADGILQITSTGSDAPEGRDYELWVIAGEDLPVSLGILARQGATTTEVPTDLAPATLDQLVFAVTVEAAGGSPTGAPTGAVVASGNLKKI